MKLQCIDCQITLTACIACGDIARCIKIDQPGSKAAIGWSARDDVTERDRCAIGDNVARSINISGGDRAIDQEGRTDRQDDEPHHEPKHGDPGRDILRDFGVELLGQGIRYGSVQADA